jgi:hypothetical protein
MKEKTMAIIIAAVVTALVVGSASYLLARARERGRAGGLQQRVEELQEEKAALEKRESELKNQVAALEEEKRVLQAQIAEPREISRGLPAGWENYFPTSETTTLSGEPVSRVRTLFGEPPFLIRSIAAVPEASREIWIYIPGTEDPTGVYIFFKGGRVHATRIDEFSGLYSSGLLDDEDFWLR